MNKQTKIIGTLLGAALAAASGVALAESTYGYSAAGTGAVSANASVNLRVAVPKLILLRVGSQTAVDEITWTNTPSWSTSPTTLVDGNNQAANWDGVAPSLSITSTTNALAVYAWHNGGAAGATLTFTGTAFTPAGGPTLTNITVADTALGTGTAIAHPGANLGTATAQNLTTNTLYSRTWTYTLGGTPASWAAGTYSGSVTYMSHPGRS